MIASHDPARNTALRGQLAALAGELNLRCRDKWTIIGSAAAWLVGADVEVADIDVMTSVRDADTLLACWASQRLPVVSSDVSELFRSRYGRFAFEPWRVEVMGGLDLHVDGVGWQPVRARHVTPVDVLGHAVMIPTRAEQVRILRSFGREKDLARAALLSIRQETH